MSGTELFLAAGIVMTQLAMQGPLAVPLVIIGFGFIGLCYAAFLLAKFAVMSMLALALMVAQTFVDTAVLLLRASVALVSALVSASLWAVSTVLNTALFIVSPITMTANWMMSLFTSNNAMPPSPSAPPGDVYYAAAAYNGLFTDPFIPSAPPMRTQYNDESHRPVVGVPINMYGQNTGLGLFDNERVVRADAVYAQARVITEDEYLTFQNGKGSRGF